jgi:propionate CoA-transferase
MKIVNVSQAVDLIPDGSTVLIGGSGGGHAVPQLFIDHLAEVYAYRNRPRGLTLVSVVGVGDFAERGLSQLAMPGLVRRTITSNIGNQPRLGDLVSRGEIEGYSLPQGVLSQLCREIAAGRPGLITHIGLDTYVDPRQTGGKQNCISKENLVELVTLNGQDWLFYHAFPIDVAVIRGTHADENGNLTMSEEAIQGEMLSMAMAAHNSGGIVIAQVKYIVSKGSLPIRDIKVPGALIDYVYEDPNQWQTYKTQYSPFYAGSIYQVSSAELSHAPLNIRKVIARRALLEFVPGQICNLGFGISQDIGRIAQEEGVVNLITLTVEQGVFGGIPSSGLDGGAGVNYDALIDQPYMFDFYDGGGLDIASLSFAEVDLEGNVNVHAFGDNLKGPGGFLNISTRTKKVCYIGTFTTDGLTVDITDGRLNIIREGRVRKFVQNVREISFNGSVASKHGQKVVYITDRAVFRLSTNAIELVEIAEGVDLKNDILDQMDFEPAISSTLRYMDARLFRPEPMQLAADNIWSGKS